MTQQSSSQNSAEPAPANEEDCRFCIQHKPALILLSSTVLMLTWKYIGAVDFYADNLADRVNFGHPDSNAALYQFASCLILLGLIPALIIKVLFRERLADYGLQIGHRLYTIRSALVSAPLFLFIGYIAAQTPGIRDVFPINKQAGLATPFLLHGATYAVFYLAWEFHFRGFLQFGLSDSMGRTGAVLVQVMASSLLHIGQPYTECIAAIAAGAFWGWLAYRTNSILAGAIQHFLLGVVLDIAIVYF